MSGSGRTRAVVAAYSAVVTLLVAGPLLAPGYLLLRDAVSTPRSYPTDAALGLGDAAPRAVPQDALLAALSSFVDGGLVVKAILLCALWAAAYGAAALARELLRASLGPQLLAATVALWNPYVAERLLQGHWSLLAGYAALPWTALTAYHLRSAATAKRRRRVLSNKLDVPHSSDRPAPADSVHASAPTGTASEGGTRFGGPAARRPTIRTAAAWAALAGALAAAGLTPTGALLAGATAIALVHQRQLLGTLVLWLAASAPWLVATVLSGAGAEPSDPAGIAAFAARAEPGLGTLGSLAGLGGIWNADAVPDSRTTPLAAVATLVLLAIVALGVRSVATGGADPDNRHVRRALLLLAVIAILFPALGATAWGMHAMEWLVAHVPGAGLLRDTQKYAALAMPAFALCAAAGCAATARRLLRADTDSAMERPATTSPATSNPTTARPETTYPTTSNPTTARPETTYPTTSNPTTARPETTYPTTSNPTTARPETTYPTTSNPTTRPARTSPATMAAVTAVFAALIVLPLHDLAWGVGGTVRPVHYPAGWQQVAERMDGPGDVAVLPGGMFRKFRYSGASPVLDPAPRMLPNDVLQTGELPVRGRTVSGEGARAREVENLLLHGGAPADLARLGVGWILVERTTPGPVGASASTLAQVEQVYEDTDLALYRVPDVIERGASTTTQRSIAIAAHVLWAALLIAGPVIALGTRVRSRSRPRN
ncbi:hypothetical protein [Nocardia beijingensis]|uniref:hypothetical protein n=1 Tax=Nocardia beijingensis TaxID=95162 RepID=UPI001FD3CEFD|nr:hypothetical protein [Nocardia beijingensis]